MASPTFVHCNCCGHLPIIGESRHYLLTSCGHVLCEQCSTRVERNGLKCLVCQANCRLATLSGDTKADIKAYFSEPTDMVLETLKKVNQINQFQLVQKKLYAAQLHKFAKEQNAIKVECEMLRQENLELKKKIEAKEECEQNWIGSGVIRSPHVGGNGFFAPPAAVNISPLFREVPNFSTQRPLSTDNILNDRTQLSSNERPVINVQVGSGRLTRQHTPTTRDSSTLHDRTNRMYTSLLNSGGSTIFSPNSTLSSNSRYSAGSSFRSTNSASTSSIISRLQQQLNCRMSGLPKR